jgi:ATP-dependent DNA helicase RecG
MNLKELRKLVKAGESDRLEFKRSTGQRTEAARTVCAMLNDLGGHVLFGVRNDGELIGQEVSEQTLNKLAAELGRIEPPAFPDIETIHLGQGKAVIVLTVPGAMGPYTFDGRPFLRRGPTTVSMTREEYERRLVERLHATRRWENEPVAEGVSIKDLDAEQIQLTLDNAIRLGRLEPTGRRDTESILRGLELVHDGKLLNAAVALFGKSDRLKSLYPQLGIRLARFRGTNRLADFADNRQYWGHAFALLRRAESFLMDHVPIAGRVVPGKMVREDQPWYPPRATREALANAICHRDYTIAGGAVAVAMYDDHLEIVNPGSLHFGMTPEKLAQPHESQPWNPIIANVFYRAGIIERWGSGTLNIIDWCLENGNPAPRWTEQAGAVYVAFLPAQLPIAGPGTDGSWPSRPQTAGEVTGEVAGAVTGEDTGEDGEEVTGEIRKLLAVVNGEMKRKDLQSALGLRHEDHFRQAYLVPALNLGIIEMTIPDKPRSGNQRYRLTKKGLRLLKK